MEDSDPMAVLQLQLMGAFAEFERRIIKKRQKEGVQAAKAAGKYQGRKPSIDRDEVQLLINAGYKPSQIQKRMGISKSSTYAILKQLGYEPKTEIVKAGDDGL